MGDRLATINMGRKWDTVPPFWGKLGLHATQGGYIRIKWHLDPSSRLATMDMDRKVGRELP